MRIEVDQSGLSHVAAAVDTAAGTVAAVAAGETDLARAVAAAMPGSGATLAAGTATTVLGDALTALTRALSRHADAVREAAMRYADTDRALAEAAST